MTSLATHNRRNNSGLWHTLMLLIGLVIPAFAHAQALQLFSDRVQGQTDKQGRHQSAEKKPLQVKQAPIQSTLHHKPPIQYPHKNTMARKHYLHGIFSNASGEKTVWIDGVMTPSAASDMPLMCAEQVQWCTSKAMHQGWQSDHWYPESPIVNPPFSESEER